MSEKKHLTLNLQNESVFDNLVSEFDEDTGKELFLGATDSGKVLGIKHKDDSYSAYFFDSETKFSLHITFDEAWTESTRSGAITFFDMSKIKSLAEVADDKLLEEIERAFGYLKDDPASEKLYPEVENVVKLYRQTGVIWSPAPSVKGALPSMRDETLIPLQTI